MIADDLKRDLEIYADTEDALFLQRFFKTGKGHYGEGDVFIGVRVPQTRLVCKKYRDLSLSEIKKLLESKIHEYRLAAVVLLANQFKKAAIEQQKEIYDFYLKAVHDGYVNNWDLVDVSTEFIVGEYLRHRSKETLFALAKSDLLWERRVAIVSTFAFIKQGDGMVTLKVAEVLLHDSHNLIQKAVGWMLREVGKRINRQLLLDFLEKHYKTMPRTMLRYAVEHLPAEQRVYFMKK
jgi:3-methyladenine DNA glycosylase AlkD